MAQRIGVEFLIFIRAQEAERTRLYKLQADHEELRTAEKVGKLIPADLVEEKWTELIGTARAKILAMRARIVPAVLGTTKPREIEAAVRTEVYAAL